MHSYYKYYYNINYLGAIPKVLTPVKETALAPHEKIRRRQGQQYLDSTCPVRFNK